MLRPPSWISFNSCSIPHCLRRRPRPFRLQGPTTPVPLYAPLSGRPFLPTSTSSDKSALLSPVDSTTSFSRLGPKKTHHFPVSQRRSTTLQAITGDSDTMDEYHFPEARLKKKMDDPSKTPLLLVACGSFSPITFLHLRMFVMAADYVKHNTEFEMVGGYLSPVSDAYKKQGLALAEHR